MSSENLPTTTRLISTNFYEKPYTLQRHALIAKIQSNFVNYAKQALGHNESLVTADFSGN